MVTNKNNPVISSTLYSVLSPVSIPGSAEKWEKIFPVFVVMLTCLLFLVLSASPSFAESAPRSTADLAAPVDDALAYPFTKDASIQCGRWKRNSQDYPYFGAPRNRNARKHAGIDIYPAQGEGTPVKAMKAGKVIKVALFYTRANGEKTYGVLIDHGDFVANYAELKKPDIKVAHVIEQGQTIGRISGTGQLHLELYAAGTNDWLRWYGDRPLNLLDPTPVVMGVLSEDMKQSSADDRHDAEFAFDLLMSDE
jgi:murein DD-endopeptidase MepM/ murein hydrolase activator NlpD